MQRSHDVKSKLRATVWVLLACALAGAGVTACGGQPGANQSPSPRPAPSVSAIPGLTHADFQNDPTAYHQTLARLVQVFLNDGVSRAKKRAMAQRIAAMPEVVAYHYVSKAEAFERFKARFPKRSIANLTINNNLLPASFDILVRDRAEVVAVARRFFHDPNVNNFPGTHDGVNYATSEVSAGYLATP